MYVPTYLLGVLVIIYKILEYVKHTIHYSLNQQYKCISTM